MSIKEIKSPIRLKVDTEENWLRTIDEVPQKGELVIYSIDNTHQTARLKVGDGYTNVNELAFISAHNMDVNLNIKINTTAYWNDITKAYIPEKDEIIVYSDKAINSQNKTIPGIKIGDGRAYCVDLPFAGDEILEIIDNHINNSDIHVTAQEKIFWNNKLNLTVDNSSLIFNRL